MTLLSIDGAINLPLLVNFYLNHRASGTGLDEGQHLANVLRELCGVTNAGQMLQQFVGCTYDDAYMNNKVG